MSPFVDIEPVDGARLTLRVSAIVSISDAMQRDAGGPARSHVRTSDGSQFVVPRSQADRLREEIQAPTLNSDDLVRSLISSIGETPPPGTIDDVQDLDAARVFDEVAELPDLGRRPELAAIDARFSAVADELVELRAELDKIRRHRTASNAKIEELTTRAEKVLADGKIAGVVEQFALYRGSLQALRGELGDAVSRLGELGRIQQRILDRLGAVEVKLAAPPAISFGLTKEEIERGMTELRETMERITRDAETIVAGVAAKTAPRQ